MGSYKKRNVRELIKDYHLESLAIQEVKLEEMDESLCCSLWDNSACG